MKAEITVQSDAFYALQLTGEQWAIIKYVLNEFALAPKNANPIMESIDLQLAELTKPKDEPLLQSEIPPVTSPQTC